MEEEHVRTISWSTEDFESRAKDMLGDDWENTYDSSKFADALDEMIDNHDANNGISWSTIDYYLDVYCSKNKNEQEKLNNETN